MAPQEVACCGCTLHIGTTSRYTAATKGACRWGARILPNLLYVGLLTGLLYGCCAHVKGLLSFILCSLTLDPCCRHWSPAPPPGAQVAAAAFTKGLLDLEGSSLTPILVSLVAKDASMLDAFGKVSHGQQWSLHACPGGGLSSLTPITCVWWPR